MESLQLILEMTKEAEEIQFRQIFVALADKQYGALLIVLSLPFCFPIQIPGFSTPFGLMLAFLGMRMALNKKPWWPKWVLDKKVKSVSLVKLVTKTMSVVRYIQKFIHPRLSMLTQNPLFHRFNGILVAILAGILALPLPIPFTNIFSAFPILFIGIGLLEEDGMFVLAGYTIGLAYLSVFIVLFVFGINHIMNYF